MICQNTLTIMIGLPCSGKDTVIKEMLLFNQKDNILLSSDDIRIELFGWEDQSHNDIVFEEMRRRCKQYLKDGYNVIYNATNLNKKRRISLIKEMSKYAKVNAILCLCSLGTIFERNLTRFERHIPEEKVIKMFKTMDVPMKYEGYDNIYYVKTDNKFLNSSICNWLLKIGEGYDQQNEHHNATVKEHLKLTAKKAYEYSDGDDILYIAGRFHDIGKPYAREWNELKQRYIYYEHHRISAYLYLLYSICQYNIEYNIITLIPDDVLEITTLIYHHMDKFIANLDKTKGLLGNELYNKLEILMKADSYRERK